MGKIIAAVIAGFAVFIGGFLVVVHYDNALRQERKLADRCWFDKGEWKDGTCVKPEDKLSDKEKVCMAMGGNYLAKGEDLQCFSLDGKEIQLPSLEGKEVVIMRDGTLVLKSTK